MMDAKNRPTLVQSDNATVKLPKKQDVITAFEAIQYQRDKLGAIVNWYNQLEDDGILILASGGGWTRRIYENGKDEGLFEEFCEQLRKAGIEVVVDRETVVIRRKPGTKLDLLAIRRPSPPAHGGYINSLYEIPGPGLSVRVSN